jgi:hypothetical protein
MNYLDRAILGIVMAYVVVTAAIPYLYGAYIAPLLFLAACALLATRRVSGVAAAWTAALVAVGVSGALIGFLNDNPGARPTLTIYVIEPLVIGLLLGSISLVVGWRQWVVASLDVALVACVVLGVGLYVAAQSGGTMPAFLIDAQLSYADTSEGVLRTNFQGFNALVFLAPWGLARFIWRLPSDRVWWNYSLCLAAMMGMGLAGRRILYLTVPAIILTAFVVCGVAGWASFRASRGPTIALWAKRVAASFAVLLVAWLAVGQAAGLDMGTVANRTATQVGLTVGHATGSVGEADPSTENATTAPPTYTDPDVRGPQSDKLVAWWQKSPIWGHGSGSVVPGYTRSVTDPYIYELTYHMLLFQFGVLGVAVLVAWVAWVGWWLLRGVMGGDALTRAMLCGLAGVLLASAVDPYLLKIDGMWMILLPFGVAVWHRTVSRIGVSADA